MMLGKSPNPLSQRAEDIRAEAQEIVRELVRLHGGKLDAAFHDLARATGLTPRRLRSHYEGTVSAGAVAAYERPVLQKALVAALEAEERRAAHRRAIWEARFERSGASVSRSHGEDAVHAAACLA